MSRLHWALTSVAAITFVACQAGGPVEEAVAVPQSAGASLLTKAAEKPPLGWNSFDSYDCRINEQEFGAELDPHGAGLYRMSPQ